MPTPQNMPGFSSFSDYLNANSGALAAEGQNVLSGVGSDVSAAQTDLTNLQNAASAAGETAGKSVPNTGGDWTLASGRKLDYTSPQAPGYTPGAQDTTAFLGDLAKAQDDVSALKSGGAPGKSPWEASLIQASPDVQAGANALGKQLSGFSNYLDQISAAGQSGYQKGLGERATPAYKPQPGPDTNVQNPASLGPAMKPTQGRGGVYTDPATGKKIHLTEDQLP